MQIMWTKIRRATMKKIVELVVLKSLTFLLGPVLLNVFTKIRGVRHDHG